ncbi:MAG: hypothetical protein A2Z88_06195 [Omnitrophica WOR_2 bacterium GWA2_47_8]|nr:MAG: hypothetical protein A2Z88_06195 [Omnitrophica WOR_2 bacterium GWA2_47_8]
MLEDKIQQDYVQAMKDRDAIRSSTLNFLRAQIKNVRIDKRIEKVEDADVIAVIKKQAKQREDSISQFEKGGRQDLVDKEKAELVILKSYLPVEMSDQELQGLVKSAIAEAKATGVKDMGNVMKVLMPKVAGKADNKRVSDLVKQGLSSL